MPLVLETVEPDIDDLPNVERYSYSSVDDRISPEYMKTAPLGDLYNDVVYQVVIRTFHEIFEADQISAIARSRFNGYVRKLNAATGLEEEMTIMTAAVNKLDFMKMNLSLVDAKACCLGLDDSTQTPPSRQAAIVPSEIIEHL